MIRRPDAVLFDCDGVLADTESLHDGITAEALTALGWPMTEADSALLFRGMAWEAIVPAIEARLGVGSVPADFVPRIVARVLEALPSQLRPVPGAPEALRAVAAAGVPVAMATNSSRPEMALKLRALGLEAIFAGRALCHEDVPRPKPAPDLYRAAAAACGADPARCAVVEDSIAGTSAGIAAGCRVLGFRRGEIGLAALGAEEFSDMRDLPRLLGL